MMTDGPFAETEEVFGGYLVANADDLDAAPALAERIPATRMGGSLEARPLVEWTMRAHVVCHPVQGERSSLRSV